MKKSFSVLFSLLLTIGLLLAPSSNVKAAADDAPVITPISGDMDFTTTVVSIVVLPGTTNFGLLPVPVGFPAGEAQYGSDGVRVTNMDSGKATACFSIATVKINQGWSGKVAVWNGVKWVLLPTTITPLDESPNSLACATILGNGTYSFIVGVGDASLLPIKNLLPPCEEGSLGYSLTRVTYAHYLFTIQFPTPTAGIPVSFNLIPVAGTFGGTISGSTLTNASGVAAFDAPITLASTGYYEFFFRVSTPTCYFDFDSISGDSVDFEET